MILAGGILRKRLRYILSAESNTPFNSSGVAILRNP